MDTYWWNVEDLWVSCRRQFARRGVGTNNFLERSNKTLKQYLQQGRIGRIDTLFGILVTDVSMHYESRYEAENLKSVHDARTSNSDEFCKCFTRAIRKKDLHSNQQKGELISESIVNQISNTRYRVDWSSKTWELCRHAFDNDDGKLLEKYPKHGTRSI
jgi:hypothetical protein